MGGRRRSADALPALACSSGDAESGVSLNRPGGRRHLPRAPLRGGDAVLYVAEIGALLCIGSGCALWRVG